MIVQFRNEKVSNHGSIPITIDEAYGGNALSRAQCYRWFEKFQNGDFDVRNEERGRPAKIFEHAELQALVEGDDGQTQEHLA
ncbi:hypothetical protein TNCV_3284141 [Trichonephila clavipes]|nr:hypothetical protein TNCV_3284141 [Trichonephila clavipes]